MDSKNTTRRSVVKSIATLGAAGLVGTSNAASMLALANKPASVKKSWDAIVIGAGVFGAWTASHLQAAGKRVLLLDAAGPANAQASSGGESRMIRSAYGADAIYSEMSLRSLQQWKRLSTDASLPLFNQTGVLFLFQEMVDYARQSIATHEALGIGLDVMDTNLLRSKFPQIDFSGIEFGLYEAEFGALMARRAVQHVVADFVKAGGQYLQASASAPAKGGDGHSLQVNGETLNSDLLIYACGPWLPKLFPELVSTRLFVTRQELAFVAPPAGNGSFAANALPGWADFNGGDLYYGFPDLEGRGFKIAHDRHGVEFDPDSGDRRVSSASYDSLRAYIKRRFPALADQPFIGERVCQYTNSSNGDFLIDKHPAFEDVFLVGAGSGHGFKHGPEVGRMAAEMVLGSKTSPKPRFSFKTKQETHHRTVV